MESRPQLYQRLILAGAFLFGLIIVAWAAINPDATGNALPLAFLICAIALLSTRILPEYLSALIILLGAVLLAVAPPEVVFSGFATGGFWLTFAGIIIGLAIHESGLGNALAQRALSGRHFTFMQLISALVLLSFGLGFLIPATIPRLMILLPIGVALAEELDLEARTKGYNGIMLAIILGTFAPTGAILTANLPTIVHVGAMEAIYGISVSYAEFFALQAPVVVPLRILAIILVIRLFFNQGPVASRLDRSVEPLTVKQRNLLIILCITLLFWATDSLHHIKPAWISLTAAVVLLLPWTRQIERDTFVGKANLAPSLYIAGILAIGAIVKHTGLDQTIGGLLFSVFDFRTDNSFLTYYAVIFSSMVGSLMTTGPALPALMVPLAQSMSAASGMELYSVLMTQVIGLTSVIFPYQVPPLAISLTLCQISAANLTKGLVLILIATLAIVAPLNFLFWRYLGLF